MIRQTIDTLALLQYFFDLKLENEPQPRHSLLDVLLLMLILEHPESAKADLTELLYGSRQHSKSSLDRPIQRLMGLNLIAGIEQPHISTKAGQGRTLYTLTDHGERVLRQCQHRV